MTTIADMDLPDEVVTVAYDTIKAYPSYSRNGVEATIRATLQALVDMGRAKAGPVYIWSPDGRFFGPRKEDARTPYDVETLLIRLSPQRKEKEP